MKRWRTSTVWMGARGRLVAACALGAAVAAQPAGAQTSPLDDAIDPATVPMAIRGLEYKNRLGEQVPTDLEFTDSSGKRVRLGSFFGQAAGGDGSHKPVAMMLVYYRCPMQCPGMLARFQARLDDLGLPIGEKLNVLIVSFDPTDTPAMSAERRAAALAAYTGPRGAGFEASWAYLTDAGGAGMKLAEALGFPVRYLPAENEFAHGSDLFILSPEGKISRYLGFDPPAQTLRLSLVEASEGKIATTLDRVLLWCFHFDPGANSYVVQAWRVMQVGATATAVCLGSLLTWMLVIERRRRARHAAAGVAAGTDAVGA